MKLSTEGSKGDERDSSAHLVSDDVPLLKAGVGKVPESEGETEV